MGRLAAIAGWSIAVLTAVMTTIYVLIDSKHGFFSNPAGIVSILGLTSYAVVGAAVVTRHPGHRLGWLLLVAAAGMAVATGAGSYVDAVDPGGSLWTVAAILTDIGWMVGLAVPASLLGLLIPDGRLPSRRWRPVAAFNATAAAVVVTGTILRPDLGYGGGTSPIGVSFAPLMQTAGGAAFPAVIVSCVLATILRYRRSSGVERLQLKWIVGGFIAVVGVSLGDSLVSNYLINRYDGMPEGAQFTLWMVIPVCFAVAIFRYRLYGIDVIIRRTLVYGCLVATLAALYVGGLASLGWLLAQVAGRSDTLPVTASTLLAAAAFQPLRSRLQRIVDRRFFRARYDASQTLEAFAGRLRDEVDLAQVGAEVTSVVSTTLRPAHMSVWVRPRGTR